MSGTIPVLVGLVVAFGAALPLRRLALRLGVMDNPGKHKSHSLPTPYLGGVAIALGLVAGVGAGRATGALPVVGLVATVMILGLADDLWNAGPLTKLIVEFVVAGAAIALGYSWHLTDSPILNALLTAVWLVGLTNSFNLLDNMDGLSSTLAAAALLSLALLAPSLTTVALAGAGAAIGFLLINKPPARMYMGDAGSLMLGFTVAICTVEAGNQARGLHSVVLTALPVAVALLDTSLVVVSRIAAGRPIQLGGRDHFSHRLLMLGLSRYAVLALALVASLAASAAALLASRYPGNDAFLAIPIMGAFVVVWLRLLSVDPYSRAESPRLEVHHVR